MKDFSNDPLIWKEADRRGLFAVVLLSFGSNHYTASTTWLASLVVSGGSTTPHLLQDPGQPERFVCSEPRAAINVVHPEFICASQSTDDRRQKSIFLCYALVSCPEDSCTYHGVHPS